MAEREAHVAPQVCAVQRHGAIGQLDRDQAEPRLPHRRRSLAGARGSLEGEEPAGPERGLARRRMAWVGSVAAQPHLLDSEGGRGSHYRAQIEGLAHRLEQQAEAGLRDPPP